MLDLKVTAIVVTPFAQNCRFLQVGESPNVVVVDPGGEADRILAVLQKRGLICGQIWLTHSHLDHCGGVAKLKQATGATLSAHQSEAEMRAHVTDICQMYGLPAGDMSNCPEPDRYLMGGEELLFEGANFKVIFTPGHSPGHLCFYHSESGSLLAGDTVFSGSIGRTDLPGGNHRTLMESIKNQILSLPDNTRIMPGHGPDTTVGVERETNPFLV